jgi:cytosine/adenosine deaminase-related metal-dependent hydrolase
MTPSPASGQLTDCVVLVGPRLEPFHCARFAWSGDTITALDRIAPAPALDRASLVVIPGLCNGHTHVGDCVLPDGATGLTLEQAFFRPHGYKYRELAKLSPEQHLPHLEACLRHMARSGTIAHLDFREQGPPGAALLRAASASTGVHSVILNQFDTSPFADADLLANLPDHGLPPAHRAELAALLALADGFSESTINDLTDAAWREIRAATSAQKKLRAIHCLENAGYRERSLAITGRGDLARALEIFDPHLVVHLTAADPAEIALLARSGKAAALNPRANATLGLPLPPVAALLRSGATLLLGTDNVMLNPPNLLAELDFTYRLARSQFADAASPDPAAILAMATTNAAGLLGPDFPGALTLGAPASFVVLDFTRPHLRHSRHLLASLVSRVTPDEVLATYRHGRPLHLAPNLF